MSRLEETLLIDTPENITFNYEIAGIGSRFLAALIDTALILILQILVNFLTLYVYFRGTGFDLESELKAPEGWLMALLGLLSFLMMWGYYILFEILWNGRSPGKRFIKLRVIRVDGTPITAAESVVRNLVRLVDFLPAYYGVGVIAMFINSQARRLGDLAAGTLVVRENTEEVSLKSIAPPVVSAPRQAGSAGNAYPVERLSAQDIQLIESYLKRRDSLINRSYLSLKIAQALLDKMGVEKPYMAMTDAEVALEMILFLYRRRMSGETLESNVEVASSVNGTSADPKTADAFGSPEQEEGTANA